jgi:hypothetical protein
MTHNNTNINPLGLFHTLASMFVANVQYTHAWNNHLISFNHPDVRIDMQLQKSTFVVKYGTIPDSLPITPIEIPITFFQKRTLSKLMASLTKQVQQHKYPRNSTVADENLRELELITKNFTL